MINNLKKREILGFTLIEIIIVMAVMSILSTIMIISYSSWQRSSYTSTVKSDLMNAVSAMENARNFSTGYPSSLSGIYTASKDVNLTVAAADAKTFCLDASSSKDATILYYVDSQYSKNEPQTGTCAGRSSVVGTPNGLAASNPTTNSISINWTATVSGATGYNLQQATNPTFSDAKSIGSFGASPTLPYVSTGLSASKKYYYRVQAFNANGSGAWSASINASTVNASIAAPSAPVVSANTVSSATTYSWAAVTCAAGQKTEYQYKYTITPSGYDSGWVDYGSSLSISFTTSTEGQDYVVAAQARCVDADTAGAWSASGSATYHRPGTWKALTANCGIASDDQAYCWGYNTYGGVGDNTTVDKMVPTPLYKAGVLSGKSIRQISSDYNGGCVIASDNQVYCWGYNNYGEIGNNTSGNNVLVPTSPTTTGVLSGKTILKVAANSQYMRCVIASDNYPYCWGYNTNGEVGDNTFGTNRLVPTAVYRTGVLNGLTVKQISVASHHACVIASDDKVYCWGQGINGKLGDNTTVAKYAPVSPILTGVLSGKTIKAVSVGYDNTCVIASDNKPYCWGRNNYGQIGDNTSGTDRLVPTAVLMTGALNGLTVKAISVGLYNVCVIASDNNGYCWGNNAAGNVGDNTSGTSRLQPTKVYNTGALNGLTISSISHGTFVGNAYALASDKSIYSWGSYMFGSLGNNASANSLVPAQVNAPF
jgi:prepilin-type N-terminal cleavage/methylation domain-containing protein